MISTPLPRSLTEGSPQARPCSAASLTYASAPDPELVQSVLREVIVQYFKKTRRDSSLVWYGRRFSHPRDRPTPHTLDPNRGGSPQCQSKAGVLSIEEAKKSYSDQKANLRQQIFATQAELAERNAILKALTKPLSSDSPALPQLHRKQRLHQNHRRSLHHLNLLLK